MHNRYYTILCVFIYIFLQERVLCANPPYITQSTIPGVPENVLIIQDLTNYNENNDPNDIIFIQTSLGDIYRSADSGRTYVNQSNEIPGFINEIVQSPVNQSYIAFLGNDVRYITTDGGITYTQVFTNADLGIIYFEFHPTQVNWVLFIDGDAQLYISTTLGGGWVKPSGEYADATWGDAGLYPDVPQETIYAVVASSTLRSYNFVTSTNFFASQTTLVENSGDFIFGVDYLLIADAADNIYSIVRGGPLTKVSIPSQYAQSDFGVLVIGNYVFMTATTTNGNSDLLRSDSYGSSLQFILANSTGDVNIVDYIQNVVIANQQVGPLVQSLISFDSGTTWAPISAPAGSSCTTQTCSLHFSPDYPITEFDVSPGTIYATGNVGEGLQAPYEVFVSQDAGVTWQVSFPSSNTLSYLGYQGNIISLFNLNPTPGDSTDNTTTTNYNFGAAWTTKFYPTPADWSYFNVSALDSEATLYGLFEFTNAQFELFTYSQSQQLTQITTIDFQYLLTSAGITTCTSADIETWNVNTATQTTCTLGSTITYNRRLSDSTCILLYNDTNYGIITTCNCTRDDYECDSGFGLQRGICVATAPHSPPANCQGTYQQSLGYRSIYGDTCEGGLNLLPISSPCPVKKSNAGVIAGAVVGSIGGVAVLAGAIFGIYYWRNKANTGGFQKTLD